MSVHNLSEAKEAHDQRRLPDVPPTRGGIHLEPGPQEHVPRHDPASQPLLHLLLAQHVPDGRPAQRTQQYGGLHTVMTSNSILFIGLKGTEEQLYPDILANSFLKFSASGILLQRNIFLFGQIAP